MKLPHIPLKSVSQLFNRIFWQMNTLSSVWFSLWFNGGSLREEEKYCYLCHFSASAENREQGIKEFKKRKFNNIIELMDCKIVPRAVALNVLYDSQQCGNKLASIFPDCEISTRHGETPRVIAK